MYGGNAKTFTTTIPTAVLLLAQEITVLAPVLLCPWYWMKNQTKYFQIGDAVSSLPQFLLMLIFILWEIQFNL